MVFHLLFETFLVKAVFHTQMRGKQREKMKDLQVSLTKLKWVHIEKTITGKTQLYALSGFKIFELPHTKHYKCCKLVVDIYSVHEQPYTL